MQRLFRRGFGASVLGIFLRRQYVGACSGDSLLREICCSWQLSCWAMNFCCPCSLSILLSYSNERTWVRSSDHTTGMVCQENSRIIHGVGSSERAFIMAGWLSPTWQTSGGDRVFAWGRTMAAISITAFVVFYFVYPPCPPAVQPQYAAIGFPVSGHAFWGVPERGCSSKCRH